ncbi:hypothetical protein [Terricaulis sp.]|uniref:hypothetical protein n=1 Tax=Terricaulis sp. TaxID=2768686 RepID=UPI00378473C3
MKKFPLAASVAVFCLLAGTAEAQRVRGGFENAAGGVTAGAAEDVRGPFGGRAVGERGLVTDGSGNGASGSRGCARGAAGGVGCGQGTTTWNNDGEIDHQQSGYASGPFGGRASSEGSLSRDDDGDWSGERNSEFEIGGRTYSAETTFDSDDGLERDWDCSGC